MTTEIDRLEREGFYQLFSGVFYYDTIYYHKFTRGILFYIEVGNFVFDSYLKI